MQRGEGPGEPDARRGHEMSVACSATRVASFLLASLSRRRRRPLGALNAQITT